VQQLQGEFSRVFLETQAMTTAGRTTTTARPEEATAEAAAAAGPREARGSSTAEEIPPAAATGPSEGLDAVPLSTVAATGLFGYNTGTTNLLNEPLPESGTEPVPLAGIFQPMPNPFVDLTASSLTFEVHNDLWNRDFGLNFNSVVFDGSYMDGNGSAVDASDSGYMSQDRLESPEDK
jgi:hypothetical protein